MKKKLLIFIIAASFIISTNVKAQTESATPSSSSVLSAEDKEIKDLKDKIATKVAEMRQKDNRAVSGSVTDTGDKTLKVKDQNGQEFAVSTDDPLTNYYQVVGNQKKEIKFSDIKKGAYIIISGVINDTKINASVIYIDDSYLVKSGKITEVNKDNYFIKIETAEKDIYIVDIESYTKKMLINIKTLALEPIGFSKIKEGDVAHFVTKKTGAEKEPNRFSAQKILIIPQEYFIK